MMERLSGKDELGYYAPRNETLNCLKHRGDLVDRLAYYEDMEEQGRLVKLPCKIGDTIYRVHNGEVLDWWQIMYIEVYEDEIVLIDDSDNAIVYPKDVGKTAFLCRKDAEQALKGGAN